MLIHRNPNSSLVKPFRRLTADRFGNVTITFGLSLLSLMGIVGGAIDFARWHGAKSKIQTAMDSASLAGGRALQLSSTADADAAIFTAKAYYEKMKPNDLINGTPVFAVAESGTVVRGVVEFAVPSPFLSLMGIDRLSGKVVSEAVVASGGNAGTNLEVSLMLDTTGSMSGQKIEDLKDAAKDLIDIVVWSDQGQYTSKVALAPFSARVNVGEYLDRVTDVLAQREFSGTQLKGKTCATERTGPNAFTDERPTAGDNLSAYSADSGIAARDNIGNYSASGKCMTTGWNPVEIPTIVPLSNNKDALKSHIDSLPAAGATAGSLGTAWAWYLLSPKWTGIWQGNSMPAPYSDLTAVNSRGQPKLKKVAVLMTDGIYNTTGGQSYGDTSSQATTISGNAVKLCANMKAAGITVYTVGFQLGGNTLAVNTLKACASRGENDTAENPSYFFNASNGDELRSAFRQIALQLSTLRIRM